MRPKRMLLAALVTALAVPVGIAAAAPPPGSDFPWGQPPAWITIVPAATMPALPGADFPWGQPPAWIPTTAASPTWTIAGSDYPWGQPPAWIPTAPS